MSCDRQSLWPESEHLASQSAGLGLRTTELGPEAQLSFCVRVGGVVCLPSWAASPSSLGPVVYPGVSGELGPGG